MPSTTVVSAQGARLEQALQDCATANILLGLSNPAAGDGSMARTLPLDSDVAGDSAPTFEPFLPSTNETEFAGIKVEDGLSTRRPTTHDHLVSKTDAIEGISTSRDDEHSDVVSTSEEASYNSDMKVKPTIYWKNGYALDREGHRRDLTPDELDTMRRERNRLHAKMTRDRKKMYIETLSRAVSNLEVENRRVREALTLQLNATKIERPDRFLEHLGLNGPDSME
mmetsp:Transcript_16145/g.65238  ORF Transcript_16145/g.65238 Transcript_16145/m.65238 type:complete len:225 (+) Transcript_16145:373-1047(+)